MHQKLTVVLIVIVLCGGAFANPMALPDSTATLIIFGALVVGVITFVLLDAFGTEEETAERLDFSTELADDKLPLEPLLGVSIESADKEQVWAELAERGWERSGNNPAAVRSPDYGVEELTVVLSEGEYPAIESVRYTCQGGTEAQLEARYQELIEMYQSGAKGIGVQSGTGAIFGCYWEDDSSAIEYFPAGEGGPRIELEISYR